jgi:hypothetical protein
MHQRKNEHIAEEEWWGSELSSAMPHGTFFIVTLLLEAERAVEVLLHVLHALADLVDGAGDVLQPVQRQLARPPRHPGPLPPAPITTGTAGNPQSHPRPTS